MTTVTTPHPALLSSQEIVDLVVSILDEKKAENIVTLDISEKAAFADFLVIASGNVARQVIAMSDHIVRTLRSHGIHGVVEGIPQGDWVLVDFGTVVVHLFRPEVRLRYNLEKMWAA